MAASGDDEDELPRYLPGLAARFDQPGRTPVLRKDDDLQFVWGESAPDERCLPGPFAAAWRGRLFVMTPGEYRLHLFIAGQATLKINGRPLLSASAEAASWHESRPITLGYGYHPLEVEFQRTAVPATLKLFWSGPQFGVEPVPERHLFHDPGQSPPALFEEGRLLVGALRCAACHDLPRGGTRLPAPALTHLSGNLQASWLVDHLSNVAAPADGESNPQTRRMPYLPLSRDDAEAIAAYLSAGSASSAEVRVPEPQDPPPPVETATSGSKKPKPRTKPSVQIGRQLAHGLGCLACHRVGELGSDGLFAGGDLTRVAAKRPPEFFVRWLKDAKQVNADHRMPQFQLEPLQRDDLICYLATRGRNAASTPDPMPPDHDRSQLLEQGKKLVAAHRCGACHRLPGESQLAGRAKPVTSSSDWKRSCLGDFDSAKNRPGYRLSAAARSAVVEYLSHGERASDAEQKAEAGRFVLAERNCLACHSRGLQPGLSERVPAIAAALPELASVQAALLPPSLNGVGDKLTEAAFRAAVKTERPPLRPWLRVRMPKFDLSEAETAALETYFVAHDRIPDRPEPAGATADETAQRLAARRLVTADGFGCTSCHKIGSAEPSGTIAISAMGTDLTLLGDRLRKPWFDRWVRNPARIIPRMEMPAVQLPVRGVLHDDVHEQLAAVWKVLNEPGFTPPKPNPVRIVRSRNVPGVVEPPHVLTDVFVVDDKTYVSPVVIGLPNRHNILFDLETNRLAAWWTGDTAAERTKGKSWYWEPGGAMVVPSDEETIAASDLDFAAGLQRHLEVTRRGQNLATLDEIRRTESGVTVVTRLSVGRVRQTFEPLPTVGTTSGLRRTIEFEGVGEMGLDPLPVADAASDPPSTTRILSQLPGQPRAVDVTDRRPDEGGVFSSLPFWGSSAGVPQPKSKAQPPRARLVVEYRVDLPLDTFPSEMPALPNPPPQRLDVVPGFAAVRLPLLSGEMPTGLAWSADGTLLIASLKGRIHAARDTDGDGLENSLTAISDDLATPYGLAAAQDKREVIDVITKTALVRLHDDDRDGFFERQEIAADGWGHTDDYHDWAVGLPKIRNADGSDGGYFVALPCQQDDRDPAMARHRGQGLRLVPRAPTQDDPRRFAVEPFCGGLRFPMGLAVDRRGRLFATDNQGNYNPFNELNHLQSDRRYGFINKLERTPDFKPPTESPAVEIPHPWTRSVNGICFLDTPAALHAKTGRDHFGPFEGHLIGCEFNQRFLVRMSLEEIDGVVQGAVYPFSLQTSDPNVPTFEGPNVAAVAPDGDLYVGSLLDSGWGGGQNTGSIARLVPAEDLPPGIAEVRAVVGGFVVRFTRPIDAKRAAEAGNYTIERYRRESTPQYGGDDKDRRPVRVRGVEPTADGREVRLRCDRLEAGYVYEFHLQNLTADGATFFPAEAHYTLKKMPR